ncbi:MAG TPA: crotonase/enoyl-CoA hydratase family protein [Jatrophihabitans sp.]|jgi:enoyl-CoA hydratase
MTEDEVAMTDTCRIERDGSTLVITIDRPEVRNAIDRATADAIAAGLDELDQDTTLRVGVLTGAGGTFSSGMDLKAFSATGERPQVEGRGLAGLTEAVPGKPLIAAVEGHALAGGCEIVLACDLVVAAEGAAFGLPEVKRGLIAGSGGLLRLAERIPANLAMEYVLTGRPMSADIGAKWGLVNELVPDGQTLTAALRLAAEIAANSPIAVRASTRVLRESRRWPAEQVWPRMHSALQEVLAAPDAAEGARAFVDKRAPRWSEA